MKKFLLFGTILFTITSCSSFTSTNILVGDLSVSDKSVSDEILCLTAFTSEVKIPKSKIQQDIINELSRRNITPEQCSSYAVSTAGGVGSFCSDFNKGYVNGESSRMTSFGHHITLQDMLSVQKNLGIDCNTKQYVKEYNRTQEQNNRVNESPTGSNDLSKAWGMFQPKTNVINCMSLGSSAMCNDAKGNSLYINKW